MSTHSPATIHDSSHSHPANSPGRLLFVVFFSFIAPILAVVGLVYSANADRAPAADAVDFAKAAAARIQKVGLVSMAGADRETKTGEQVYLAQCSACHATGVVGAPKFGDAAAWGPRIKTGFSALLNSALKGKNAMGAQGGGNFSDFEIARAVVHMANAAGATFDEPKNPAAADAAK